MKLIIKILIAIYIGLAIFKLTDPSLHWVKPAPTVIPSVAHAPTEIKIPKISLDIAISPSVLKGNDWQVYDDRVAWLSTSSLLGQGNTILYAHERPGLFLDLYKLKTGDEVDIFDGKWHIYQVKESHIVNPGDINAVFSDKNHITMYTCQGSFDQKRLVVYAE